MRMSIGCLEPLVTVCLCSLVASDDLSSSLVRDLFFFRTKLYESHVLLSVCVCVCVCSSKFVTFNFNKISSRVSIKTYAYCNITVTG